MLEQVLQQVECQSQRFGGKNIEYHGIVTPWFKNDPGQGKGFEAVPYGLQGHPPNY